MRSSAKLFAALFLIVGALALTPGAALAQHHWHGGGWHRGGWGPGFGFGLGIGNPYYYGGPYAYGPVPNCGWARVRVWRGDHWGSRRAWRCW